MTTSFQRHPTVPPRTRDPFTQGKFKWSADFDVPPVGEGVIKSGEAA
ncbi:hypothetical protein [Variovorax sp. Varisp62]